jgi:hypothetical protein
MSFDLVQYLLVTSANEPPTQSGSRARQNPQASQMTHLKAWHAKHWPAKGSHV